MVNGNPDEFEPAYIREQSDETKPAGWFRAIPYVSTAATTAILVLILTQLISLPIAWLWMLMIVLVSLFIIGLGLQVNGKWYGAWIDSRNRVSLSRMQITLWTILTLGTFLAIAIPRSVPGALLDITAEQLAECQATYLRETLGILDLEEYRSAAPLLAAEAEEEALRACAPSRNRALNISFPGELLAALGISTVSFAGATQIKSLKRNRVVVDQQIETEQQRKLIASQKVLAEKTTSAERFNTSLGEVKEALNDINAELSVSSLPAEVRTEKETTKALIVAQMRDTEKRLVAAERERESAETAYLAAKQAYEIESKGAVGILKVNAKPSDATLRDLFQGDEIGNYDRIDLSKVQMFLFTQTLILAYGAAVYQLMRDPLDMFNPLGVALPLFSTSLIILLGISHTGYLSVKSIDHTRVG